MVIPPFDLLMPEVNLTGVAMSVHAFPSVIDAMARGDYPLDEWVETISLRTWWKADSGGCAARKD